MKGLRRIIREARPWTFLAKDKRWAGLLVCLMLALFFWFLLVLNSPGGYTKKLTIPILVPELPGRYIVTDSTAFPSEIEVGIRATGGRLFRYSLSTLFFHPKPFRPSIDSTELSDDGGVLNLNLRKLRSELLSSRSLPSHTKELLKDTVNDLVLSASRLALAYEPLVEGEAEVIFAGQVDFGESANLKLTDTVGIFPKIVKLYGPKSSLDSIVRAEGTLAVRTDTAAIKIGDPGHVLLPVSLLPGRGMKTVPDSVYVSFQTEELVHSTFMVRNIEIRGLDKLHTLKLLPAAVKVTTLIPRSREGEMDYDPQLYVDASRVIGAPPGYQLEVRVGNLPDRTKVEMIQLDPDRLDFILEEKIVSTDADRK